MAENATNKGLTPQMYKELLTQGFPCSLVVKNSPANAGNAVQSLGWEDPLEEEKATHSSILAWEILCTEEPESIESQRVGQTWLTHWAHMHTAKYQKTKNLLKKK